ncbi:MAG TPA: hypothetical protein DD808_09790 [Halieaceae bacterium]|nr:hypothetical protein [Halieaceae bacterium]
MIPEGFFLQAEEAVQFDMELEGGEAIADLLAMTPHMHRASPEGRAAALALTALRLCVDVHLLRLVRE